MGARHPGLAYPVTGMGTGRTGALTGERLYIREKPPPCFSAEAIWSLSDGVSTNAALEPGALFGGALNTPGVYPNRFRSARAEVVPKTRRASRPTLGSKVRRLTEKSQRSDSKKLRGRTDEGWAG